MAMTSQTSRVDANAINDHCVKVFSGKGTWDAASAAAGLEVSDTITISGVAFGDMVIGVGCSVTLPAGVVLAGKITAANTVTVSLVNNTAGAVDLGSAVFTVLVVRAADFPL